MTDTTYSIELKGLNLPEEVKSRIDKELRAVVLSEIAKVDLGNQIQVESLPRDGQRSVLGPILGIILRNLGTTGGPLVQRAPLRPTPPTIQPVPIPSLLFPGFPPLGGKLPEILETLYIRPDVRAAVISNSRAFAELLSQDEQASRMFHELVGGPEGGGDTERVFAAGVVVAVVVGGLMVGAALGWASRPQ
jgi:hypothetical protein